MTAALSFVALAALSSSASAQKADRPNIKAGDQRQFFKSGDLNAPSRNFKWLVVSVSPEEINATEDGKPLLLTSDLKRG